MRTLLLCSAAAALVLSAAACHPVEIKSDHHHDGFASWDMDDNDDHGGWMSNDTTPLKTISTLTCPDTEGDLTLTTKAPDGTSCDYAGRHDDTVHLQLLPLAGTAAATLAPMETELKTLMPPPKTGAVNIEASKGDGQDKAKIDMPFFHVNADGGKADVKIFGTTIHADNDKADIHTDVGVKNTTIHAGDGGAEIRSDNTGAVNSHLVYILAGDGANANGYHAVGYLAAGPIAGPLVVAEFKSKSEHQHGHMDHGDIGALMKANLQP